MSGKDLFGQASPGKIPNGIAIQSVARDASGNAAANRNIYLKVELKQDAKTGESVLLETHSVISNDEGIFNFYIGQGVRLSGISSLIFLDWKGKIYFLNIKMAISPSIPTPGWDLEKEYVDLGTEQIWSVPYAFTSYRSVIADSATSIAGILPGSQGGTGQANVGRSIILGGDLEIKGTGNLIFQTSGASTIELPTSGKMVTTTSDDSLFNKTLMSPLLLGVPKAVTPNVVSNDNSIATTAFVNILLASDSNSINKKISQFENSSQDSIDKKLNIKDTSLMLSPYALKFKQDHVLNGVSIGKYSDGDTILVAGKTLDQFLNDLVTRTIPTSYTRPSVSINSSPAPSIVETGFDPGTINLSSVFVKNDAGKITSIMYSKNGDPLGDGVTSNIPGGITNALSYSVTVNHAKGDTLKTNNVGVKDTVNPISAGSVSSANITFTPKLKKYWGISTKKASELTSADIKSNNIASNSEWADSKANPKLVISNTTGLKKYLFYAYPKKLGELTDLTDGNGFNSFSAYDRIEMEIINAYEITETYYVYVQQNGSTDNLSYIIK
jgi:hypothetical protein